MKLTTKRIVQGLLCLSFCLLLTFVCLVPFSNDYGVLEIATTFWILAGSGFLLVFIVGLCLLIFESDINKSPIKKATIASFLVLITLPPMSVDWIYHLKRMRYFALGANREYRILYQKIVDYTPVNGGKLPSGPF